MKKVIIVLSVMFAITFSFANTINYKILDSKLNLYIKTTSVKINEVRIYNQDSGGTTQCTVEATAYCYHMGYQPGTHDWTVAWHGYVHGCMRVML